MFSDASASMASSAPSPIVGTRRRRRSAAMTRSMIDPIVRWVRAHAFTRVALQFPDELLGETVRIVSALRELLLVSGDENREMESASTSSATTKTAEEVSLFVLADNTFGSCCPDEITAEHYSAQCIIHFGGACLSKSAKLPVFYVEDCQREDDEDLKVSPKVWPVISRMLWRPRQAVSPTRRLGHSF